MKTLLDLRIFRYRIWKRSNSTIKTINMTFSISIQLEYCENRLRYDSFCLFHYLQWDDQYIYLIMEYCSGGDMSNFIRSKRTLPENILKRFLQQIGKWKFSQIYEMRVPEQNIYLLAISLHWFNVKAIHAIIFVNFKWQGKYTCLCLY